MKQIIICACVAFAAFFNGYAAMTEQETIAATLWMEARGEGKVGIKAVASVIANRAKKSGKSMARECLKRNQFACWNGRAHRVPRNAKGKVWEYCNEIARKMVRGQFKVTNHATHYYNHKICNPSWGAKMKDAIIIGNHRFGRV